MTIIKENSWNSLQVCSFFHDGSNTWTHLVYTEQKEAVLIDPCLDYNMHSAVISTSSADCIIDYIQKKELSLRYILETHTHADHLTAAPYIQSTLNTNTLIGVSQHILSLLNHWKQFFNFSPQVSMKGQHFDLLLKEGEHLPLGQTSISIIETPGHTPCGLTFIIDKLLFIGDTLFHPSIGTARTDFPSGGSDILYDAIQKIYSYDDEYQLFLCHDYPQDKNSPQLFTTLKEQKENNFLLPQSKEKKQFIKERDAKNNPNNVPRLIWPALHFNLSCGHLPKHSQTNDQSYICIPVNAWNRLAN